MINAFNALTNEIVIAPESDFFGLDSDDKLFWNLETMLKAALEE